MSSLLGSTALGLVWGWLIGGRGERFVRPVRILLALGSATLLLTVEVLALVGWRSVPFFLGACMLALLLHLGWRRDLRSRYEMADKR